MFHSRYDLQPGEDVVHMLMRARFRFTEDLYRIFAVVNCCQTVRVLRSKYLAEYVKKRRAL